jgi:hypothetical protein
MMLRFHDGQRQFGKRMLGQMARLFLGGALLLSAACSSSSSSGSDGGDTLTVTPGANMDVKVTKPGKMSFNVKGINMDPEKDSQPIVFFYDGSGYGGGRTTGGFQGDLRNYKLKVFDVNGELMGDESEKYGYEWKSADTVHVIVEWNASSITTTVGGVVAVKSGTIPSTFTIGVGYPPSSRPGWDGAVYTDINWP